MESIATLSSALVGVVVGAVGAWVASLLRRKEERLKWELALEQEREKWRMKLEEDRRTSRRAAKMLGRC